MPNPTINTDGISDAEKATAKFQFVYRGRLAQLSEPNFALALCAHEAGHLIYFAKAGCTSYKAMPARIQYVPRLNDYEGSQASVQILEMIPLKEGDNVEEWFGFVACALAAGGVAARKVVPSKDGGDTVDRERLKSLFAPLKQHYGMSFNFEEMWKRAQERVSEDLRDPKNFNDLLRRALSVRGELGL
jgi:hypothetical protein